MLGDGDWKVIVLFILSILEYVWNFLLYSVERSNGAGAFWEGVTGEPYVNDLFMEQPDHDLPALCDLPVKVGDDPGRKGQALLTVF